MTELTPARLVGRRYANFDDFFKGEFRSVVGLLVTLGAEFDEAQDAANEAMQEVAVRWSKIDSPTTYVRTVARRKYIESDVDMRRLREAVAADPNVLRPLSYSLENSVTETYAIIAALVELPPMQRSVMAWTLQSYTTKEIADLLQQKEDTVRSNLRYARKSMKEKLLLDDEKMPKPNRVRDGSHD